MEVKLYATKQPINLNKSKGKLKIKTPCGQVKNENKMIKTEAQKKKKWLIATQALFKKMRKV